MCIPICYCMRYTDVYLDDNEKWRWIMPDKKPLSISGGEWKLMNLLWEESAENDHAIDPAVGGGYGLEQEYGYHDVKPPGGKGSGIL